MSQAATEIIRISGHAGTVPGAGLNREFQVCKLVDTTTCIGCKACEVACLEWNGYTVQRNHVRQHLPDDAGDGMELLEPDQVQRARARRRQHDAADAQRSVHALRGSGLPGSMPGRRRHRAVRQRHRRFPGSELHRLRLLHDRLPVQHSEIQPTARKVFKCTLCNDRVSVGLEPACIKACPTGCLHFGTKPEMKELAETRAAQLRDHSGFPDAGVYDPAGVGGTHVIYVLHDAKNPELYGGLPKDPHIPWSVRLWKRPLKWLGNLAMVGGLVGLALHYMRFGPKKEEPIPPDLARMSGRGWEACMSTGAVSHSNAADQNEELIPRYTFGERVNHWLGALSYIYLLDDRAGVLVALSVLAGRGRRRRSHGEILASVVRTDFYCIALLDVQGVAPRHAN